MAKPKMTLVIPSKEFVEAVNFDNLPFPWRITKTITWDVIPRVGEEALLSFTKKLNYDYWMKVERIYHKFHTNEIQIEFWAQSQEILLEMLNDNVGWRGDKKIG